MLKYKKRILVIVGVLLVIAIISVPTLLLLTRMSSETTQAEQRELQLAFVQRYGAEAELVEIVEPESLYVYIWELEGMRYFTLSINGLFVELGQVEVEK